MTRLLVPLVLVVACSKSADPKVEQKPAAAQPAAQEAAAQPPPNTPPDPKLVAFCTRAYFTMMDCFKDDEFWQVFATMYFANTNLTSDETDRTHWIGVMKEDLLKLYNEHGFEANCKASLEHNKWPSEKSVKAVGDAAKKSCSAFGSAFGYMVFNEGAFHAPRP
jgi:hypothetical protein